MFLADPLDVPPELVEYLAEQLGIEDSSCVKRYTEREKTKLEHAWEIQREYGLRSYSSTPTRPGCQRSSAPISASTATTRSTYPTSAVTTASCATPTHPTTATDQPRSCADHVVEVAHWG